MKKLFYEIGLLIKSVPVTITTLFVLSIVGMNLLANKSVNTNISWLAIDCGLILSWLAFLTMDILAKRYGPRGATIISILALMVNLFMALIFFVASFIPGVWGESFVEGEELVINTALNNTFRGTWYIILGSSIAFIVSAIVNNFLNYALGNAIKDNGGFGKFAIRSYISTMIGQFVDNLIFALIVSKVFFGWTYLQCFICAISGAIIELLFEIIFSPLGYKVLKKLEKEHIGDEYLEYRRNELCKK